MSFTDQQIVNATFCGLFFGEGCITFNKRKDSFYPRLAITQRIDNIETLYWLRDNFGGNVCKHLNSKSGRPYATWTLASASHIAHCLSLLLESPIPSTKKKQAEIMLKFLETIHPRQKWTSYTPKEAQIRTELITQFRELKPSDKQLAKSYAIH